MLQDSLAAEIEGTMRKELSLEDPECEEQKYGSSASCYTHSEHYYLKFRKSLAMLDYIIYQERYDKSSKVANITQLIIWKLMEVVHTC